MVNREVFRTMPQEMLFVILDQLPNPVLAVQSNLLVLYANRAAQETFGLSKGSVMSERGGIISGPDWNEPSLLFRDDELQQDVFRFAAAECPYLCFQKRLPAVHASRDIQVLSIQEEQSAYDLYFDCRNTERSASQPDFGEGLPRGGDRLVSRSPRMESAMQSCARSAKSDLTVLFLGESGTGKTMLAEYIHRNSRRGSGPLVVINCAAIAKELLESELFGYAPYAFTNASDKGKTGLLELADKGTILLDEIGDMPMDLQGKILHAVETQSITPVGGRESRPIDVRILAATNKDLSELVRRGEFREDLLWRLNTLEISLPPLRERREDILYIADHIRSTYNERNGTDIRFTSELEQFLQSYDWPGNVRQLKNTVEKMLFTTRETEIPLSAARGLFTAQSGAAAQLSYAERIEARERRFILHQYQKFPSTRKLAAALNISQSTATRLIQKYVQKENEAETGLDAVSAHTDSENRQGRLTQHQLYQILDIIPNHVCVVDRNLICIADKYHAQRGERVDPALSMTSTVMFRAGYKMARAKKRPITLECTTASGRQRKTIITQVCGSDGGAELYVSTSQIQFNAQTVQRRKEIRACRKQLLFGGKEYAFFCSSPEMSLFLKDVDRASWQDLSVLIQGESGTGKSVLAHYLHEVGNRKDRPFLSVNCAAMPQNLIEAELFGYEKGAFTGAGPQGKKGLFEVADGGTLFLDEIGDIPLSAQAKFLDVIENKRFIPIGGNRVISSDVRIICATNQDLKKLIEQRRFREDLYWRINVIELNVPSLRVRPEDVERYAQFFLQKCHCKYGGEKQFSPDVLTLFLLYDWPGNLRQLSNTVERSYVMSEGDIIKAEDLPESFSSQSGTADLAQYNALQRRWEHEIIAEAIARHGSARGAASALCVSDATVSRKRTAQ